MADVDDLFLRCLTIADGIYRPRGVLIFFNGRNAALGGERPIDLFERGEGERVLDHLTRLEQGDPIEVPSGAGHDWAPIGESIDDAPELRVVSFAEGDELMDEPDPKHEGPCRMCGGEDVHYNAEGQCYVCSACAWVKSDNPAPRASQNTDGSA